MNNSNSDPFYFVPYSRLLSNRRASRGWTQSTLATKTGMSLGMISALEQGARRPSLATAVKISRALGIPLSSMLGE